MRTIYAAVRDRLAALILSRSAVPVTLGDPPGNSPLPYAFITPVPTVGRAESLAGVRDLIDEYFNVTFVHSTPNNVLALCEAGQALLDEWTPTVDGWAGQPLEPVDAQPVQTATAVMEGTTNTYPRWAVVQYRLRASKE